jgi:hypothetical protein
MADCDEDSIKPLVVRIRTARRLYDDCSQDVIYEKIRDGDLVSYLDGRRRVIVLASIEADIARKAAAAAAHGFQRERYPEYQGKIKGRRKRASSGGTA